MCGRIQDQGRNNPDPAKQGHDPPGAGSAQTDKMLSPLPQEIEFVEGWQVLWSS